jgi:DNA adenine methylase
MNITKPILKWVGGKTQIIDNVLSQFPNEVNNYHEPFLGGGSVLLGFLTYVKEGRIKLNGKIYASDINNNLILFYKNIQQHPKEVISTLKQVVQQYSSLPHLKKDASEKPNVKPMTLEEGLKCKETYYYWIRKLYNSFQKEEHESCKAAAYFIFLNKTCFRGVHREGPNGFNVSFGNYKNPCIFDEDHILFVSSLLQNVVFNTQSFDISLTHVKEGDLIYMDPPYAPETAESFVGYTVDGFKKDMHQKLFNICHKFTGMTNVRFVMSNAYVDLVMNAFPQDLFHVQVIECKRSINSKKPASKTSEVIIKWG